MCAAWLYKLAVLHTVANNVPDTAKVEIWNGIRRNLLGTLADLQVLNKTCPSEDIDLTLKKLFKNH